MYHLKVKCRLLLASQQFVKLNHKQMVINSVIKKKQESVGRQKKLDQGTLIYLR